MGRIAHKSVDDKLFDIRNGRGKYTCMQHIHKFPSAMGTGLLGIHDEVVVTNSYFGNHHGESSDHYELPSSLSVWITINALRPRGFTPGR